MSKQQNRYTPSAYTHLANIYSVNEFLSIQRLLRSLSFACLYNAKYPILKLLKAVCRRMLINEFESIFFAFVIQTNRWNIGDPIIQAHWKQVRDLVCYITEDVHYKSITLYLLLCAYTVKYYLSEDIDMYTAEINRICPDFRPIFEAWAKQYAQTTLKINPKMLNKVYKEYYLSAEMPNIEYDYNSLVDNLLQISPSYNPDKDKVEPSSHHQVSLLCTTPHTHSTNPSRSLANITLISSSSYLQQILPVQKSRISSQNFHRQNILLNSSNFGLKLINLQQDIKDIGEMVVGFKEAVSDNEMMGEVKEDFEKGEESEPSELVFRKKMTSYSNLYESENKE